MWNIILIVVVSFAVLTSVSAQNDNAPGETDSPSTIIDFCGLSRDCNPRTHTQASGAVCRSGDCICTGDYELIPNSVNKLIGCRRIASPGEVPFPLGQYLVSVNVEFVWNFLCEQLPFTFDVQTEALGRRLAIRAGASATDFIVRRKCGSVHLGYVISNVPILTASTLDAIEWLDAAVLEAAAEAPTLVQLGQPSVVDITAGTSTCPVIFPTLVAHAIGGSCQPTSCAPGFVLTQYESADLINTCDEIITTPTPPSDSDDLSIGAIAGIVVACVVFCAIIVVVSYLIYQRYKKSTYDQNSQRHYSDSESDVNRAPDLSSGQMEEDSEDSGYFDVGI